MQQMHQSYKCMKAQQKKLSGCASNSLAHEDLGYFEEARHWNIQAKFYNEKNSHQYMKVTTQETLYHEDHSATLKHKCGKRDSSIVPSLFFSHFIYFLFFFLFFLSFFSLFFLLFFLWASLASFIFVKSEVSTRLVGESQSSSSFPHWDNALIMKIITLLFTYNSILRTKYDSI